MAQAETASRWPSAPQPARQAGPRYLAGVDGWSGATLRGWAVDLKRPRAAIALQLEAKGAAVLEVSTGEHRADLGAVLDGNVAGFAIDFAALPAPARKALIDALDGVAAEAPPPPRLVALRLKDDGSLIELGGFDVSVGELRRQLGLAPPKARKPEAAPPAPPVSREARVARWLMAYLDGAATVSSPARRFAIKLNVDIARSTLVGEPVKRHAAEIAGVFDPFHYLDQLAAPEAALANPLLHYVLAGWRDGASPSPLFSPAYYRRLRGPIDGDPLLDFMREGAALGVDPHPLFDVAFYRERHLGGASDVNPLAHYLDAGGRARLDPSPLFDSARFLEAFGFGEEVEVPLAAYIETPACYDFALTPTFDSALYRHQVEIERGERLAEPPYAHYLAHGFRDETLLPNLLFDPLFYRERNKLEIDGPALLHYLAQGEARGLACHPVFSPAFYDQQRGAPLGQGGALAHALAHPGELRSDPRMEQPIDPRMFDLVRRLVAERGVETYSAAVYRDANPDLARLDDEGLAKHYRRGGAAEQRLASLTAMMRLGGVRVRDLPLGFVVEDYASIYPDLAGFRTRLTSALFHWARYGRHERRLVGKWQFRIADLDIDLPTADAPLRVQAPAERVDVCILIHVFYPDLLAELVAFAQNFREVTFDIFINLVDISWTPELEAQARVICPGAFVMLSNDDGRDIGGFTRLIEHVDIARYDLFAFMHSKKSPHVAPEKGEYWRRALLSAIAGSPETARECVALFRDHPRVGMIGAKDWRSQVMGKNQEQYEKLLDLLSVRGPARDLDYISGFMFLIRSEIVARLFETLRKLEFEYGGDKDLAFHNDGQLAHGVERAVPALARQMGYDIHYR